MPFVPRRIFRLVGSSVIAGGLVFGGVLFAAVAEYPVPPDSQPQAGVPKGSLQKYTLENSRIFPGTRRDYWVYVPAQYDPQTPACVYVNQDGIQYNAPVVFDNLIARKEMPVTIGVFVTPGVVKALSTNALDRFNRSFEYDGLGGDYARFVLEELLPEVETKKTADGRAIRLSARAADRCIGGASSGAICAFTAAWERPDAFSRVFSTIGTYVGLRGGHIYPTLIRKFEPRPIRVFLQDGSDDLNIYGGDWWMANQTMERALVFAGYEVQHAWGEDGHNTKHGSAIFPDAMRFLWKDWPEPVKNGASRNAYLNEILVPGASWQNTAGAEYPASIREPHRVVQAEGLAYAVEPGAAGSEAGKVWRISADGARTLADSGLKSATGLALSPDQSLLYVADGQSHWVYSYQIQPDGALACKQRYFWLHSADDADDSGAGGMCCDRDGRLYVATRMGIQVCDQAGRVECILSLPGGRVSEVGFGGQNGETLFARSGDGLYARKVKVRGAFPSEAPLKPAAPRL